ncbi:MAG TPA: universal stress protein [Puia sp.]|nr:universal stress protein [Puia sp.]
MKKHITILVPTDFSAASRAGMRFAMQWASQQKARLIFTHVLDVINYSDWSKKQFEVFAAAQRNLMDRKLRKFVGEVLRRNDGAAADCDTRVVEGPGVSGVLSSLGRRERIDLICMGTNGAGTLQQVLGTTTSYLIRRSDVPVVAVPATYRKRPVRRILYATDLVNYKEELKKVRAVADSLGAEVMVLHLLQLGEHESIQGLVYRAADPTRSTAENLRQVLSKFKPSMIVMFTDHHRTWLKRLVSPSQSEKMALNLSVPLLVLGKR